jgi:hypothetical protein
MHASTAARSALVAAVHAELAIERFIEGGRLSAKDAGLPLPRACMMSTARTAFMGASCRIRTRVTAATPGGTGLLGPRAIAA